MSEDWEGRSAQELEGLLREELGRVSLVGELELDPDSPLYRMALSVVKRSLGERGVNRFDSLSTRCPAALSVVLVADGIFGYEGGEYWPNIALDVTGQNEPARLGQQFEKSLDSLGLERFESARRSEVAKRYLMPILLHGKFPRYCAPDLWGLLSTGFVEAPGQQTSFCRTGCGIPVSWPKSTSPWSGFSVTAANWPRTCFSAWST